MRTGRVPRFLADRQVNFYLRSGGGRPEATIVDGQPALRYHEPFQGAGPRATVIVFAADRVLRLDAGSGEALDVFRYRPELNP